MHNIPKGSNIILTGKIAWGQTWRKALIDIWNGSEALITGMYSKWTAYSVSEVQDPSPLPQTTNLATICMYGMGLVKVSDLGWPSEGQYAMSQVKYGHVLA